MRRRTRLAWPHRLLLALHPRSFRRELGDAIEETLATRGEEAARGGLASRTRFVSRESLGLLESLIRERSPFRARGRTSGTANERGIGTARGALARELRHAARRLARAPAFTAAAALTIALAIAANTTVFAVARGILLTPLPYPDSERLVQLDHGSSTLDLPAGLAMTSGLYVLYRERASHLGSLAIHQPAALTLTGDGEPERAAAVSATPSLATVMRVQPRLGRWFTEAEGELGGPPVAVLSHGFWERRFGADPAVLGRAITLNGVGYEVLGVMPEGFTYPEGQRPDLWVPLQIGVANTRPTGFNYGGVARLRDGSTLEELNAEQERLLAQLPERFPEDPSARSFVDDARPFAASRQLHDAMVGSVERTLWTLLGAAGLVLLIACANVANLVLVRTEGRGRELAVRRALGAGPGTWPAILLSEAGLLSGLGGVVGLALASLAVKALVSFGPQDLPRLDGVVIDAAVVVFAAALSLASALLFGASPLIRRGEPIASSLHERGRGNTSSGPRMRARNVLVGAQVALSLVLLIASGLMARSFQRLHAVDPGFQPESVLAFDVALSASGYPNRQAAFAFHEDLLARLRALPGVVAASATTCAPLAGFCHGDPLEVEGVVRAPGEVPPVASIRRVADGYFEGMGIDASSGRVFEAQDQRVPTRAAVIDERLAQLYFPGQDPVGKRISPEYMAPRPDWYTVVGVVPHVVTMGLSAADRPPQLYLPLISHTFEGTPSPHAVLYVVRTAAPLLDLVPSVRGALGDVDPEVPIGRITTLEDLLARDRAPMAFTMVLLAVAAASALALGVVGIYGVISYAVTQRTAEIGVRIALGARPGAVAALILRQGGTVAFVGLLVGLAGALAAARFLDALLFSVSSTDPATYALVSLGLFAVSLLACWLPARRVTRLDPLTALRSE